MMLLLRRWRLRYVEISYDAMRTEGEEEARQLAPLDDDAASVPLTPFPEKEEAAGEDEDDYLTVHDDDTPEARAIKEQHERDNLVPIPLDA